MALVELAPVRTERFGHRTTRPSRGLTLASRNRRAVDWVSGVFGCLLSGLLLTRYANLESCGQLDQSPVEAELNWKV